MVGWYQNPNKSIRQCRLRYVLTWTTFMKTWEKKKINIRKTRKACRRPTEGDTFLQARTSVCMWSEEWLLNMPSITKTCFTNSWYILLIHSFYIHTCILINPLLTCNSGNPRTKYLSDFDIFKIIYLISFLEEYLPWFYLTNTKFIQLR